MLKIAVAIICSISMLRMKLKISIWNALLLQGFALAVAGATVDVVEKAMACGLYFQGAISVTPYFAFFNSQALRDRDFDSKQQAVQLALLKQCTVIAYGNTVPVDAGIWRGLVTLVQQADSAIFPSPDVASTIFSNLSKLADLETPADVVFSGNSRKQGVSRCLVCCVLQCVSCDGDQLESVAGSGRTAAPQAEMGHAKAHELLTTKLDAASAGAGWTVAGSVRNLCDATLVAAECTFSVVFDVRLCIVLKLLE